MSSSEPADPAGRRRGRRRPTRREFLRRTGLVGGGAVVGAAGGTFVANATGRPDGDDDVSRAYAAAVAPVPLDATHQPGVVDRPPSSLRFTALDLRPASSAAETRAALREISTALSAVAADAAGGRWGAAYDDTARGLRPAHVTLTVGVGGSALAAAGIPVPTALAPLPRFNNDQLDAARCHGDLGVQVCAEDAHLAAVVTRAAIAATAPHMDVRWQQNAFLPAATATTDVTATRRNLMGHIDGTGNPTGALRDATVWVPDGVDPRWMVGGTYLVCRRIRVALTNWQHLSTAAQEDVIGRRKDTGAAIGNEKETDRVDFDRRLPDGRPAIATNAHIRLAHPEFNGGATMLRRSYSFDDGYGADGEPDAGVFFQAFQVNPHTAFVPVQLKLAALDALTPFVRHTASAVFAVPAAGALDGMWSD